MFLQPSREAERLGDVRRSDYGDAVAIGVDVVARFDSHTLQVERYGEHGVDILRWRSWGNTVVEDGVLQVSKLIDVPNRSVDQAAPNPSCPCGDRKRCTEVCDLALSTNGYNDDLAAFGNRDRLVDGEVVAGRALDGESSAH